MVIIFSEISIVKNKNRKTKILKAMRNHVESMKYFILTSFTMYILLCSEESFIFRSNKIFSFNAQLPHNFTSRNSFHRNNSKRSFQIQIKDLYYIIRSDVYK